MITLNDQSNLVESLISFHLIRKSINNLTADLKYFHHTRLSDSQMINILGDIEELQDCINKFHSTIMGKESY